MHRFVSILLLLAIALQGTLGGARTALAICFGDAHPEAAHVAMADATDESTASGCVHDCSHGDDAGLPVVLDAHGEACPCVDLELSLVDLLVASRTGLGGGDDDGSIGATDGPDHAGVKAGLLARGPTWRGPPEHLEPPPAASLARAGAADRLATVRLAAIRPVRLRL